MKSYDVNNYGASDQVTGQAKKPWVTPSLHIISLQSAAGGTHPSTADGTSGHFQGRRS
jgi:hypothetical protein